MKMKQFQMLFVIGGTMLLALTTGGTKVKAEEKIDKYVQKQLPGYLECFKDDIGDKIEITQGLEIAGSENDEYAYFVASDGEVIGEVSVCEKDGEYITCFNYGEFEEIQYAYDNKDEKIAIARTDEDIVVYSEKKNKASSIIGEHEGKKVNLEKNNIDIVEKGDNTYLVVEGDESDGEEEVIKEPECESFNTTTQQNMGVTLVKKLRFRSFIRDRKNDSTSYVFREVPFVQNDTAIRANGVEKGICWAASSASIIRYHSGRKSLTAKDIFNYLKKTYGGTPKGTDVWYDRMWVDYGFTMNHRKRKLSYAEVKVALDNNKPIYCEFYLYEYDKSAKEKAKFVDGHAVVLCGTYKYNSRYYYVYMDPNKAGASKYVVNSVPKATKDTNTGYKFYYYNGNFYANNWVRAFWLKNRR